MNVLFRLMCLVLVVSLSPWAGAGVLIEDSFDYSPGNATGKNGGAGWGGGWLGTIHANHTGSTTIAANSLSFSDYATEGNQLVLSVTAASGFGDSSVRRNIDIDDAGVSTGDLWISYLYQRVDDAGANGNSSRTAEFRFNDGSIHFGSSPKASGSQGIVTRYEGSNGATVATANVQDGGVYLVIVKYANLGQTTGNTASMWVLSESAYDGIKAGGILETELDGAAILKAMDASTSAEVLTDGESFRIFNATSGAPFIFAVDELRIGTDLESVVPVPEPASISLMALGCVLALRPHMTHR